MVLIGFIICIMIAVLIGIKIPQKEQYNSLDRVGFIFNIILSILYIPISFFGIFSLFAADSVFMYPEFIQKIIYAMITIGITLPFTSVLGIVLSVVFRKKGKRILSFVIQFIPLIFFIIMFVTFMSIGDYRYNYR